MQAERTAVGQRRQRVHLRAPPVLAGAAAARVAAPGRWRQQLEHAQRRGAIGDRATAGERERYCQLAEAATFGAAADLGTEVAGGGGVRGARVLWALERLRSARLDPHGVIPELDPPDCSASRPEQRARAAAQYAAHRRALLRETQPQQRAECRVGEGALARLNNLPAYVPHLWHMVVPAA